MNEILDRVKQRKFFYRDYYRSAVNGLWIALAVIIVLSLIVIYLYIQREEPSYYATSSDGKLARLTPLDAPNYSKTPLIQ